MEVAILLIMIFVLIYVCSSLHEIKKNIYCIAHNTAKTCEHLYEIKNKLDDVAKK